MRNGVQIKGSVALIIDPFYLNTFLFIRGYILFFLRLTFSFCIVVYTYGSSARLVV